MAAKNGYQLPWLDFEPGNDFWNRGLVGIIEKHER